MTQAATAGNRGAKMNGLMNMNLTTKINLFVAVTLFAVIAALGYWNNSLEVKKMRELVERRDIATVSPAAGTEDIEASIRRRRLQTAAAAAVVVLVTTCAIAALVHLFVDRPLQSLMRGIRRFRDGAAFKPIHVCGKDEIGELANEFNTMAATLEAREKSLKHTRDYLMGIVENSADLIVTLDINDRIEMFNRGAERILGCGRAEMIGRDWKELFFNESNEERFLDALKEEKGVDGFEVGLRHRSGRCVHTLLTKARLWDTAGNIVGKILIGADITAYKAMQDRMIASERLAAIGQAVVQINHSTKNILNTLTGGAYMVKTAMKKEDTDMLEQGWAMVETGIGRIKDLCRDMLDFTRTGALDMKPGSICGLISEVVDSARHYDMARGIIIRCDVSSDIPDIMFDPRALHTAILNLVLNAVDACRLGNKRNGGEVTVTAAAGEDNVIIEVRDNGCGIPDDKIDEVFQPFFSTKFTEGNGLGLPVTKKIITEHGGGISVRSSINIGTTFTVTLPLIPASQREHHLQLLKG